MPRFKIMRIILITAKSKDEAWEWLHKATPEQVMEKLDFQSIKEIEEPTGFVKACVKQVFGK